jgi:hypothetical protein
MNPIHTPRAFLTGDGLRIWTNPRGSPNFIVLLRGIIYTATIPKTEFDLAMRKLSAGAAPETVLGENTREIILISLTKAELNRRANTLEITYVAGLGTAHERIRFAYSQDLDELEIILRKSLSYRFRIEPIGFSVFRTLGGPLLATAFIGVLYWVCSGIISPAAGHLKRVFWHERFLQDQIGPERLLWIIAGLGVVTFLWAMWRVLTRPTGLRIRKVEE